jgi:hypothetical protein
MRRLATGSVIAMMQNVQAIGDRPIRKNPRDAVRILHGSGAIDLTVAASFSALPFEATGWGAKQLGEEALLRPGECGMIGAHGNLHSYVMPLAAETAQGFCLSAV